MLEPGRTARGAQRPTPGDEGGQVFSGSPPLTLSTSSILANRLVVVTGSALRGAHHQSWIVPSASRLKGR